MRHTPEDPLTPRERAEYEDDLISFSDRELDLLGDLRGQDVLYAGGTALLWIEGLSQRVGARGTLTALDSDARRIEESRERLAEADLPAPARLVAGSVFDPPFAPGTFDLVYSAGLFHELDVRDRPAEDALDSLASLLRPGGRLATSDFVDSVPAIQLEDEGIQAETVFVSSGACFFGIGPPERLAELHEEALEDVRWRILPPFRIRHLDKLFLAEDEPEVPSSLPAAARRHWLERREALRGRVQREGYTRPATAFVEAAAAG